MPQVLVIGSINLDNVFKCKIFPNPGETILCDEYFYGAGGKGLNQAVAVARDNVTTIMAGAIGNDPNGSYLLEFMKNENINTNTIIKTNQPTGVAHITIDKNSENSIIVASGANMSETIPLPANFENNDIILSQLEIRISVIEEYFKAAKANNKTTILNCAPVNKEAETIFELCDILIMNEHELQSLANLATVPTNHDDIHKAAIGILCNYTQTIIVTLGSEGVMVVNRAWAKTIPARKVKAIDTTGAGDCFCGIIASRLAQGMSIIDAAICANIAASIQVTHQGAAAAMPSKQEIDALLD